MRSSASPEATCDVRAFGNRKVKLRWSCPAVVLCADTRAAARLWEGALLATQLAHLLGAPVGLGESPVLPENVVHDLKADLGVTATGKGVVPQPEPHSLPAAGVTRWPVL